MTPHEEAGSLVLPGQDMKRRHEPRALDELIPLVLDAHRSINTRRAYERALHGFFDWVELLRSPKPPFNKALVQRYLRKLNDESKSPSTVNQALSAIRRLATEAVDNNLLDPAIAAGIEHIKPQPRRGRRTGQWLESREASKLLSATDLTTNKGLRDRVLLGLLLECGLRREEAAALDASQVQTRGPRTILADVKGKGNRVRTVPVNERCAIRIRQWMKAAKIKSGPLLRRVDKADQVSAKGMTPPALYKQVESYAAELGIKIAPHDLRRTFAKLAYQRDPGLIAQIKEALGHSSVRTTEIYLGVATDLDNAATDALDLDDELD